MAASIFIQIADRVIADHKKGLRPKKSLAGVMKAAQAVVDGEKNSDDKVALRQAVAAVVRDRFLTRLQEISDFHKKANLKLTLVKIANLMANQFGMMRRTEVIKSGKIVQWDAQRQVIYKLLKANNIWFNHRGFRKNFLENSRKELLDFLRETSERFKREKIPLSINTLAVKVREKFELPVLEPESKHDPVAAMVYMICREHNVWHGNPNKKVGKP